MSLLHRVKEGIKQRYEKGKQEKKERKAIDREAQAKAHQEYLKAYRQERMKAVTSSVRAKAKRDASGGSRLGSGLRTAGKGAKPVLGFLSGAGQNLLKGDAFDVSFHNLGIPGFEEKPKTVPKQAIISRGSKGAGTTITVDGTTIHVGRTGHKKAHVTHVQKKKKPAKIFNPLDF